jgi:CheY-like chemotaxis protein
VKSSFQFARTRAMADTGLTGRRFLVVEDEYLIAADVAAVLEALGVEVTGPVGTVAEALKLVETEGDRLDGAVLDVNLAGDRVYPVADALRRRGIPFLFTTGYDTAALPDSYADVARCRKPTDERRLERCLSNLLS